MKNQKDLVDRMTRLMDSIESGGIEIDKAGAVIKAADVVVQVMKTEAAVFAASRGTMLPEFMAVNHQPHPLTPDELAQERERQQIAANKAARIERQGRA